jgi:hypothetical protein
MEWGGVDEKGCNVSASPYARISRWDVVVLLSFVLQDGWETSGIEPKLLGAVQRTGGH